MSFFCYLGRTYTPPNGLQLTLSSAIQPSIAERAKSRRDKERERESGREGGRGRGRENNTQGLLTRSDTLVMKNLGQ